MAKRTVKDVEVGGKRVLVRVDFNIPLDPQTGQVSDDTRLRSHTSTIQYLRYHGASVILCSHLGRPEGRVVEGLRMAPVAERLSRIMNRPIATATDCIGSEAEAAVARLHSGEVLLLENLRFHPGEETNDSAFAQALAQLADIFVNDAFAAAHRAHASTVGMASYLPAVAGFLMDKEMETLTRLLSSPARPFAALIGGAKVSTKIGVLENLLSNVDSLLIGGGMAVTFLKAQGVGVGLSQVEEEGLGVANRLLREAESRGLPLLLPTDVVVGDRFAADAHPRSVAAAQVPSRAYIMDIGPQTVAAFSAELGRCRTVLWNGPMGVYEFPAYARGTQALAQALAGFKNASTVVGGGETVAAVVSLNLASQMSHVSTGGGATLEFLEGKTLPGVAALPDRE